MKQSIFRVRTANQCIEDAKAIPTPKMLFDSLWFERELCIFFADTNVGKTILATQIARSIASGVAIPGFRLKVSAQPVLYYDFELSDKQFAMRFTNDDDETMDLPEMFHRIGYDPTLKELQIKSRDALAEIRQHALDQNARVIIIDNLSYFATKSLEAAQEATEFMREMKTLKEELGLSILLLSHTPKRNKHAALTESDLAGSAGLSRLADSLFAMGASQSDPKIVRYIKQLKVRSCELQYGADNVILCQIHKPDYCLEVEFLNYDRESDHLHAQNRDALKETIRSLHENHPEMSKADIARAAGTHRMAVTRALGKST